MKRVAFIVIAVVVPGLAAVCQQISYTVKNARLETVFAELEKQSGYTFFYKAESIRQLPRVSVELKRANLKEALEKCLRNLPLTYTILESTVVITAKKQPVKKVPGTEFIGRVVDERDEPVPGATVQLRGGLDGTMTDSTGSFVLEVPAEDSVALEVSCVGYERQVIEQPFRLDPLVIRLKTNAGGLDQVQVIGYGQTSRRLNTGNVSTLKREDLIDHPVSNVLSALNGKVAGMNIVQQTGIPGGAFVVNIRGINSISSSSNPLILIDGLPYLSSGLPLLNNTLLRGSALNYLDMSSIERVDVLKDADATAIYGTRAANGVVLITTRTGKPGRGRWNVAAYSGIGHVATSLKLLNTQQYLMLRREAHANDNEPVLPYEYDLNGTWDTTRNTDWHKVLRGNLSYISDVYTNVSGGTEQTQYFVGGGYQRQGSVQLRGGDDRMGSLQLNVKTTALNDRLSFFLSGNYSKDINTIIPKDISNDVVNLAPDAPPLYKPDGTLNFADGTFSNPLLETRLQSKNTTLNFVNNARVSWHVLPGLDLTTTLGYHDFRSKQFLGTPLSSFDPDYPNPVSSSQFVNYHNQVLIAEPQVSYKKKFGRWHAGGLAGATFQKSTTELTQLTATGFTNDALLTNIAAASSVKVNQDRFSEYKYHAVFGRLNYDWDQRLLLTLNGRYDGSSRFGPERRWHFFGSTGLAWIFSAEGWSREHLSFLSFGKLRGSYGTTGNDGISDYQYLDTYRPSTSSFMGVRGQYPTGLYNPDLAWELTKKAELGLDLGFLRDRVFFSVCYYRNRSSDMLVNDAISAVTGFNYIYRNTPATIDNRGWEMELHTTNINTAHFRWNTHFNVAVPTNKLVAFPGLATSAYNYELEVGQSVYTVKVFRFAGVNKETGLYQLYDSKGGLTSVPDENTDRTGLAKVGRRYYGGLENHLVYKNFSLNVLLMFVKQTGPTAFYAFNSSIPGLSSGAMSPDLLGRWQKTGDRTDVQRMTTTTDILRLIGLLQTQGTVVQSTRAYGDASYIRLKNVSLGYECPRTWMKKVHMEGCRFYIQGENLLTFTHYQELDPESMYNSIPPLRTVVFGLSLTL